MAPPELVAVPEHDVAEHAFVLTVHVFSFIRAGTLAFLGTVEMMWFLMAYLGPNAFADSVGAVVVELEVVVELDVVDELVVVDTLAVVEPPPAAAVVVAVDEDAEPPAVVPPSPPQPVRSAPVSARPAVQVIVRMVRIAFPFPVWPTMWADREETD